jgi:hypothetical protein
MKNGAKNKIKQKIKRKNQESKIKRKQLNNLQIPEE